MISFVDLVRVGRSEANLDVRKTIGTLASAALPQLSFQRLRTSLLRATGVRIGARSTFLGTLRMTGSGDPSLLSIGDDTTITGPLHVDLSAPISIGNHVQIGHDVALLTVNHEIGPPKHRCGKMTTSPIFIQDGVWLASRVVILPGVIVGMGSVVAAGAVVTKDVPANTLVGGAPARVIRSLTETARSIEYHTWMKDLDVETLPA
jgi:acetyltransferase-like isoleucine patch superfamily enzyme